MGKKSLVIGAAIGYVLGARAGRKRYDQIVSSVSRLWNDPKVQSSVNQAQTAAVDTAKTAKDAVVNNPKVQETVQAAKDKLPGSGTSSSTSTTGSGTTASGTQPGSTTPATPTPVVTPLAPTSTTPATPVTPVSPATPTAPRTTTRP